jgi:capsular polysaccharide biosynthesis protein
MIQFDRSTDPAPPRAIPIAPPRMSVSQAIARYWFLVLAATLVCVGAGVALGLTRSPVYEAQTQLSVGRIDVGAQALPGYVEATKSLAAAYSRSVNSQPVTGPVARRLRMKSTEVAAHVSATPIPQSPVFSVIAQASSGPKAIRLANVTGDQVVTYVTQVNKASGSRDLLRAFRAASEATSRAAGKAAAAKAKVNRTNTAKNRRTYTRAAGVLASAQLRRQTLSMAYQSTQAGQGLAAAVGILSRAATADSDRSSTLQRLGFIGLLVGLALGVGIAVLRAASVTRRSRSLG